MVVGAGSSLLAVLLAAVVVVVVLVLMTVVGAALHRLTGRMLALVALIGAAVQ